GRCAARGDKRAQTRQTPIPARLLVAATCRRSPAGGTKTAPHRRVGPVPNMPLLELDVTPSRTTPSRRGRHLSTGLLSTLLRRRPAGCVAAVHGGDVPAGRADREAMLARREPDPPGEAAADDEALVADHHRIAIPARPVDKTGGDRHKRPARSHSRRLGSARPTPKTGPEAPPQARR